MRARQRRLTTVALCLASVVSSCSSEGTGEGSEASSVSTPTVQEEPEPDVIVESNATTVRFDDAVVALDEMGTLRYLIATPSSGDCKVLANRDDESLLPLASVFKLYVLGALVNAADNGEIGWDDPVQIRDELDSLGGATSTEEPGTELSVRELATRMISDSDNTATDHLMDLVGREAVERIQSAMGHSQPSVNMPLLTARELTILKFSGDDDLAERYVAAGAEERRLILSDDVANRPFPSSRQLGARVYRYQDSLGWFGTAADACRALVFLTQDDQALAVMTDDPLSPNPELWPELGFKGGSDDGVATAAWWMLADDGQAYVAVVSLVNNSGELELASVIELMVALRDETVALTAD